MTAAYEWLGAASSWWWPRFADHLWQTTLVALVILGALLVLRRGPAQWRHTFCLLASAKFLIPAAFFVLLAQQAGIESLLPAQPADQSRSEEHTSELQSHGLISYAVFCLKKK